MPKLAHIVSMMVVGLPAIASAENPFITQFGGPYLSLDPSFKQSALQYGAFWMRTHSMLGKEALNDKAGFAQFLKGEIDPRLDALKPSVPQEEKVKAAAAFIKTVFEAKVNPAAFKPEEITAIDAFIAAAVPSGEDASLSDKLGYILIRYQEFLTGITLEQMKKLYGK